MKLMVFTMYNVCKYIIYMLLYSKGHNCVGKEAIYRMGKIITIYRSNGEFVSRIYKEPPKTNVLVSFRQLVTSYGHLESRNSNEKLFSVGNSGGTFP